ncbi:hypothetical protein AAES_103421 [Amazona aestiva]|uniref:Uncharacterized protein n=1 Tax=Amazona aestiva TaxID=12930 RepID=A0A0Q3PTU2_AMAAE|nr:hypothetical protein AAES_103421 [Amazona aestiva]
MDIHAWQSVWDSIGKYLGQWDPPVLWNLATEQVRNPEKLVKHLNEVCCHPGHTREGQIMAMCRGLAYTCRALFNTIQPFQKANASGSDGKTTNNAVTTTSNTAATTTPATSTEVTQTLTTTDSAATPTPSTATTPTPVTSKVATQTLTATDNAAACATQPSCTAAAPTLVVYTADTPNTVTVTEAKPKDQFVPVLVAHVHKGKSKQEAQRTIHTVRKDEEPMHLLHRTASEQELLLRGSEEEEEVTS